MKQRYINRAIGILSLSSILIASGCSSSVQGTVNENAPVSVKVSRVQEELIGTGNVYTGTVTPSQEVKITSKVAGKVIGLPVEVGTEVKAGEVLVKLDDKDFRHSLEKAEAAVAVAEANVESAKTARESTITQAEAGTVQSKSGIAQSKGGMIQSENGIIQSQNAMVQAKDAITKAQNTVKQVENEVKDRGIASKKELQTLNDAKTNLNRVKGLFEASLVSKMELEQAETAVVNAQAAYDTGKVASNTLQNKLETAQKALTAANEAYANAQKAYANAKDGYANAEENYDTASEGYAAAKKQEELAKSEAGINASEQALKQAQVNAEIAKETLTDTVITSPISGVITQRYAEEGEMVSTQSPVLVMADFNKVNILTYIPANKINEVKAGDPVQVKASSFDYLTKGKIKTVSPLDENGQGYPVEIEVDNPGFQLKEGMITDIRLIPPGAKEGIILPSKIIEHKGQKDFVYVAKGKHAKRREITIKKIDGSFAAVTKGLSNGETVITTNLSLLSDKSVITYSQEEKE